MSEFQNKYKIKYMNNLFLNEKNISNYIQEINKLNDVSFLILNGNIGNPFQNIYNDFLKICCKKKFKFVILVLGEYEYKCYNYNYVNSYVRNMIDELYSTYNNIVFLENGILSYLDKIFIGSSLYNNKEYVKNVEYIKSKIAQSLTRYCTPLIITHNKIEESLQWEKIDKNSHHKNNIIFI